MEVILNGETITTQATTLAELITERAIPSTGIAIALGTHIVRRDSWSETSLVEQAQITIIRATQGG